MAEAADYDLAIVGGGPAGQAAAEQAASAGLTVIMIDEQARMGGQILRQPPVPFRVTNWLPGGIYRRLKRQLAQTEARRDVTWRGRTSVAGLFPEEDGFTLLIAGTAGGGGRVRARRVLIAAGCYDLPVALPGWTLPGAMSAGGVQAFVKSQRVVPGDRFVFAGTHPLQLLVAAQVAAAGGTVAAVLFAQAQAAMIARLLRAPLIAVRNAPALLGAASAYLALRRAGVPIRFGRTVRRIEGETVVTGVAPAPVVDMICGPADGATIACDRVALCFAFVPQADLPRAAGAAMRAGAHGGWATQADAWMRSTVPGLYVAGETTGVAGAEIALLEGRLAGLAIAVDAGRVAAGAVSGDVRGIRRRLARLGRFAALLDDIASPAGLIDQLPDAETILCRCEDVRFGAVAAALDAAAAPRGVSGIKLITRAGMGLCQGRTCEHAVRRLSAARGGQVSAAGFTPRFPVRPVAIGDLIR